MHSDRRFEAAVEVTGDGLEHGLRLVVDAHPRATMADLREALTRLAPGAGKVVGVGDGRAQLPEDARLGDVQLVHGQHLELLTDSPPSDAPVLGEGDALRLVVEQGPQAGLAWPVRADVPLRLALDETGFWTSCDDEAAAASFEMTDGGLVRCTRGPGLRAGCHLVADRDFEEETLIAGAVIRVDRSTVADDGTTSVEQISVLRVVDRTDHDVQANHFGGVPFRIRPRTDDPCLFDAARFDLPSHPTGTAPAVDFVTTTAQVMPAIAMVAVMSLATTSSGPTTSRSPSSS